MISAKKLLKFAKKWQKLAAIRRKRITLPQTNSSFNADNCSTSATVEKGRFLVYTLDKKGFVLPLDYLNKGVVREIFNLAEEEFGILSDEPLTLPCDAIFMEYVVTLIQWHVTKDVENALLMSTGSSRCFSSSDLHQEARNQQLPICSF